MTETPKPTTVRDNVMALGELAKELRAEHRLSEGGAIQVIRLYFEADANAKALQLQAAQLNNTPWGVPPPPGPDAALMPDPNADATDAPAPDEDPKEEDSDGPIQ